MCGICGIVAINGAPPVERATLDKMSLVIRHRGPDDHGSFVNRTVALGSRRLSIIDLTDGQQPIANEDETMWIVFNGEIYNYRDLRNYLLKRGHVLRTQTDTETVLHLYEEHGPECVHYLSGIFAFAIWDGVNQEILLARDRLGVKPLYYTKTANNQLAFGSEMKSLLAHPDVRRDIDYVALNEYFSFEYVPTPRAILRNVSRLEPGHILRYNRHGLTIQKYWDVSLARSEDQPPVDWRDHAANLREVFGSVIREELVSDVPVGVLLSGGIDSSSVAAYMVELYPDRVDSFSIAFEESSFDESGYARIASKHLGTRHHEMVLTSQMAANSVPSIVDILDEPFADSSFIPTLLLSRFASEHVKVVLGGDGGDELFAGYSTLIAHRIIDYYESIVPWGIRASLVPRILDVMPVSFQNISFDFRLRRFLAGRGVPIQDRHHRWLGSFLDEEKALLFQDWLKPVLKDTYLAAYEHARACDARLPLNQLLYVDMKLYLEGDILYKVDRASMSASLEVRVPFLNRAMVDFAAALPVQLKLSGLTSKFLLKKAMQPRLPDKIINRPKKGFNMPVAYWLTGELRELVLDMLSEERIKRQGIFQYDYIKGLLDEHFARQQDNRKLLWTLLMFQLWHERYVEMQ